MASLKRKRFSIEEKSIKIQRLVVGESNVTIAKEFGENTSLIIPWIVGFIAFMSLEAVSMVYSNILRDHMNRRFDTICEVEVIFFFARVILNVIAIRFVIKFLNLLRLGISWKGPEIIEL
ncbi:hypothetical protein HHI36_010591 [Cryptolaemus montrouzieri]|uniref:Uncharacterized protein n=1 Tax=Cryptolaemus montrouzieri TaxID=559131 RepID=A0ABD2MJB9_9CUCU